MSTYIECISLALIGVKTQLTIKMCWMSRLHVILIFWTYIYLLLSRVILSMGVDLWETRGTCSPTHRRGQHKKCPPTLSVQKKKNICGHSETLFIVCATHKASMR